MKKLYPVVILLILTFNLNSHAHSVPPVSLSQQSVNCQELIRAVKQAKTYSDNVSCFTSSMLVKATYYEAENMGFVVAYIKKNEYDYYGRPYIFCGISSQRWSYFKSNGTFGSWGKSFHTYILDYACNCY